MLRTRQVAARDRMAIIARILELSKDGGINKTRIMYGVGLSFGQLKQYLALLEHNALLSYNQTLNTYNTTDKGFIFLRNFALLNGMLQGAEIQTVQ